ncbi:hypothetical protein HAX54_039328, partial [Datura stramonium]|nr:hypothetical protein [Datura stramonium]
VIEHGKHAKAEIKRLRNKLSVELGIFRVRCSGNVATTADDGNQKKGLSGISGIKSHYFQKCERARLRAISSPEQKVVVK